MTTQKNAAVGDRPTNEELVQRLQAGDASAAEELLRQNSGYLTTLAKQYDRMVCGPSLGEDLKQELSLIHIAYPGTVLPLCQDRDVRTL